MSQILERAQLPLSALVDQSEALLALRLAAIDPSLGGVLIRGPRGTAKSTMARGLAAWLDDAPFVNLPLGADEEKLVGTLDLDAALSQQQLRFEPGLLARADGGVLYVDEVNLLADHLVDLLLDTAASGVNRVERDGISQQHAACFVLIGTMNPDEGELRPQLLDRFGLCADVTTPREPSSRADVLRRRLDFDRDPKAFCARWQAEEAREREALRLAVQRLPSVNIDSALERVAETCAQLGADGLRGDLAWLGAARAHAAWRGALEVGSEDLEATRDLALRHRLPPQSEQPPPPSRRPPQNPSPNQTPQNPPPRSAGEMSSRAAGVARLRELPEKK